MIEELNKISPIDGRYNSYTEELSDYFSEKALIKYRIFVEIEYFIALCESELEELPTLSPINREGLRFFHKNFTDQDALEVKEIEKTTNHDLKAVEIFLARKLEKTPLKPFISFLHFALTSEDVNNIAYTLMWKNALHDIYFPEIDKLETELLKLAKKYTKTPLLSKTHGQSATPTTIGKEFMVFYSRIVRQTNQLREQKFQAKLNGATGTWAAHAIAYPEIDWVSFSRKFIQSFGLENILFTTQVNSYDSLAESYHKISRTNTILIDLCQDMWMYIARGIFTQRKKENEVGSSTMPHKVNPINFENAEGNAGIANANLIFLAKKLPISRLQRDLSGSTVIRNQGVALAHCLISIKNILKGIEKLEINQQKLKQELSEHWEVLAEAIQTIMRKNGDIQAYNKIKNLTHGKILDKISVREIIEELDITPAEKQKLLGLRPETYIGVV